MLPFYLGGFDGIADPEERKKWLEIVVKRTLDKKAACLVSLRTNKLNE